MKNMAIILTLIVLIVVGFTVLVLDFKPEPHVCPLPSPHEVQTFEDILDAIEWVESKGDADTVCPEGCCVGAYQITKIYIDDCNRILKLYKSLARVNYNDRWSRLLSRDITRVVTCYYTENDGLSMERDKMAFFKTAARTHKSPPNRNHDCTLPYWEKVKARLK